MTDVLVLGRGLLGSHIAKVYPDVPVLTHAECDITSPFDIDAVIRHYSPDIVVNCAGIIRQSPKSSDLMRLFKTNAQGPKILKEACDESGCRLIQISTDCVFSGIKGNYCEIDIPNPSDFYGMSKYLGEITDFPHLTVRTSFVGLPDPLGRGLLGWATTQDKLTGFDMLKWNGVTAPELARILFEEIIPRRLSNIVHVCGIETLNKYEMLMQAKEVFGWTSTIVKESDVVEEKDLHTGSMTLTTELSELCAKKSFKTMLTEMRDLWTD